MNSYKQHDLDTQIKYKTGNVIALHFASPRYEIEEFSRKSEGCYKNEPCQVISLDSYKIEKNSKSIYSSQNSLQELLKEQPLEMRKTRKGKPASKFAKGLLGKMDFSQFKNSNIVELSRRGSFVQRKFALEQEIKEAREVGLFEGFLTRREIVDYLGKQLQDRFGYDLNPFSYLQERELNVLGLNAEHYLKSSLENNSLENRIEGGMS
ncbi:MAG: hypothetical protein LAT82_00675 [Nanoarchaeota archaeon]|nr:hypothetical protein [Nanoarchaeota archaeon]